MLEKLASLELADRGDLSLNQSTIWRPWVPTAGWISWPASPVLGWSPVVQTTTTYNLTPDSTTVAESAGDITFTVTRSAGAPAETLYVSTLFDTASASGGDYNGLVNQALNFTAGQTSKTFTVHINDDGLVESQEHFRVMVTHNSGDSSSSAIDISDIYINDNDTPVTYNLTPDSTTVAESAGDITFTVTRSAGAPAETLYVSTLFDTASSSSGDYTGLVNQPLSFTAGQTSKTFTVHINDDGLVESQEHFRVMVTHNSGDSSSSAIDISNIYINDNDTAVTYNLTPDATTVNENTGDITFTVTRSAGAPAETLYVSTLFDTASSSSGDYTGLVNQALSFTAGQTTKTFTVHINDDSLVESLEHFRVMVTHNSGDSSSSAIDISDVYINDNDTAITYNLTPDSTTVAESAGDVTFTVTRSAGAPAETLYVSTLFDTASSSGGDYDGLVNQALTFAVGQTSKTFTVHLNDDSLVESQEHFRVMVTHNSGDSSSSAIDISDVYINDNDGVTTYNLTPNATTVDEDTGDVTFTVTRSGNTPAETLYISTLFDTASSGSGDYAGLVNQALSFTVGQTSKTFTVHINDDSIVESLEHFRVMITHNSGDSSAQAIDISDIYIQDNDGGTSDVVPENTSTSYSLTTGANTGTIDQFDISGDVIDHDWHKVSLVAGHTYHFSAQGTSGSLDAVAIDLRDSSGNKITSVYDGSNPSFDYTPGTSGFYFLAISAGGNGDFASKTGNYEIDLTDSGATGFSISPSPADVGESAGSFTFTITRSNASTDATVYASTVNGSAHGYATNTHDYGGDTNYNGILGEAVHFGVGELTKTVTVYINDDATQESDETFGFIVQATDNDSNVDHYVAKSTFTIHDNDQPVSGTDDFADDATDASAPIGALGVNGSITGVIGPADADDTYGDKDVFRVQLTAGHSYSFELRSTSVGGQALPLGIFTIRDGSDFGHVLHTSGIGSDVTQVFTPDADGYYYIRVGTGGAATDQGGYTLLASDITSPQTVQDDYPDFPGDASASNVIPVITADSSRTGVVEATGDKDVFKISLLANHSYQLSLDEYNAAGAGALSAVYMTLRDGSNFDHIIASSGSSTGQATISFTSQTSQNLFVRMGSGADGTLTGGYRLSFSDQGPPSPPLVPPGESDDPLADAFAYAGFAFKQLFEDTVSALTDDTTWKTFAVLMLRLNDTQAVQFAQEVGPRVSEVGLFAHLFTDIYQRVSAAPEGEKARTAFVAFIDDVADAAFTAFGGYAGGEAGGFLAGAIGSVVPVVGTFSAGLVGALLGGALGSASFHAIYENNYHDWVVENAGKLFDDAFGSGANALAADAATDNITPFDGDSIVRFDEDWYLATYSDAASAVANGTAGSAYAYFLTLGIDKGEQPNAFQHLTRADLPHSFLNSDPAAFGNSALLTLALGQYAGDGLSTSEHDVGDALNALRASGSELRFDKTLSAIASRKAIDLVANFAHSAVKVAQSNANADWAAEWSNGNELTQQFRGDLETVFGSSVPSSNFRLFLVASATGSPQDVLSQLQAQSDFSSAMANVSFDSIGIAEYAGLWVAIVADTDAGYTGQSPNSDGLTAVTEYGSLAADTLYAGTRAGTLYGLDGNDNLTGSTHADTLIGGAGKDKLNGRGGSDTASYADATKGVHVDLSVAGYQNVGGGLGKDKLLSIENVTGSSHGDTLTGDAHANVLIGGGGKDYLFGGGGTDKLVISLGENSADGGDGIDTVVVPWEWGNSGGGWNDHDPSSTYYIHFQNSTCTVHSVEMLQYTDETVGLSLGGTGDDTLAANVPSGGNEMLGGDGNDSIAGGAGHDYIGGGSGNDTIHGLNGDDTIYGDDGSDTIDGGLGQDSLSGDAGTDRFVYSSAADSTSVGYDYLAGFDATADKLDVPGTITGVDAAVTTGALSIGSFDANLSAVVNGTKLLANHAVVFTPDSGTLKDDHFLIVDVNGVAGYQQGQDLVIQLVQPVNLASLDTSDFI